MAKLSDKPDTAVSDQVQAEVQRQVGEIIFDVIFERSVLNGLVSDGHRAVWAELHRTSPDDAREALSRRWGKTR
jgi:hypothetical protein